MLECLQLQLLLWAVGEWNVKKNKKLKIDLELAVNTSLKICRVTQPFHFASYYRHHGSQSDLVSMLEEDCKISEADAAKASHSSVISDAFKKHVGFDQIEEDKRMIQDIDHTFCVPTELTALQQANLETSNKTYYTSIELFRIHIMATPMFARIRVGLGLGFLPELRNSCAKELNPNQLRKMRPMSRRTRPNPHAQQQEVEEKQCLLIHQRHQLCLNGSRISRLSSSSLMVSS